MRAYEQGKRYPSPFLFTPQARSQGEKMQYSLFSSPALSPFSSFPPFFLFFFFFFAACAIDKSPARLSDDFPLRSFPSPFLCHSDETASGLRRRSLYSIFLFSFFLFLLFASGADSKVNLPPVFLLSFFLHDSRRAANFGQRAIFYPLFFFFFFSAGQLSLDGYVSATALLFSSFLPSASQADAATIA